MAKKSRYMQYAKGLQKNMRMKEKSTSKSVLKKLKDLKGQEFKLTIPIGGADGE